MVVNRLQKAFPGIILTLILCYSALQGDDRQDILDIPTRFSYQVKVHSLLGINPGDEAKVSIFCVGQLSRLSGFSFILTFDSTALKLIAAEAGYFLDQNDCYRFEWKKIDTPPARSVYPFGYLQLTADMEDTACLANQTSAPPERPVELARIVFRVTENPAVDCRYLPLEFSAINCKQNIIYSGPDKSPNHLRRLYLNTMRSDNDFTEVYYPEFIVPDYFSIPQGCDYEAPPLTQRTVDYILGGIQIVCESARPAEPPPWGDIDGDGIPGQTEDLKRLAALILDRGIIEVDTSFAYGDQLQVSPAGDWLKLETLIEYIRRGRKERRTSTKPQGDITFFTKRRFADRIDYYCQSTTDLSGMLAVFEYEGDIGQPVFKNAASQMTLEYSLDKNRLKTIVYALSGGSLAEGSVGIISVPFGNEHPSSLKLLWAATVDFYGRRIKTVYWGNMGRE